MESAVTFGDSQAKLCQCEVFGDRVRRQREIGLRACTSATEFHLARKVYAHRLLSFFGTLFRYVFTIVLRVLPRELSRSVLLTSLLSMLHLALLKAKEDIFIQQSLNWALSLTVPTLVKAVGLWTRNGCTHFQSSRGMASLHPLRPQKLRF